MANPFHFMAADAVRTACGRELGPNTHHVADERYVTCLACLERLGLDGSVPACDKGPVKPLQS